MRGVGDYSHPYRMVQIFKILILCKTQVVFHVSGKSLHLFLVVSLDLNVVELTEYLLTRLVENLSQHV